MSNHTPPPWELGYDEFDEDYFIREPSDGSLGIVVICSGFQQGPSGGKEDAERVISCVNALSGIEDPEKWVEDMKAENQRLKEEVAKLTKMYTDNEGFTRRIAKELRELKASKP